MSCLASGRSRQDVLLRQNMALEVVSFDLKHLSNNPYLLYCDVVLNAIVSYMYMCKTGMSLLPAKVVTFHIKPYF